MKSVVLYNPYSANGRGENLAHVLDNIINKDELTYLAMSDILDFKKFFKDHKEDIIICGGDGTINYFLNHTNEIEYKNDILYYATGSGNDFLNDVGNERGKYTFSIKEYIKGLPHVIVNDKYYPFINEVGFGLDGYCCEEGDKHKKRSKKPVNYTKIALKGFIKDFKPVNAEVKVDGKVYHFENVWLAPTMHGRYYGGGMMMAPMQERNNEEHVLTLVVVHSNSRLKLLPKFPSIFKGNHTKYTDYVTFIFGKEIEVTFDRCASVQVDGDTILGVKSYKAYGYIEK